MAEIEREQWLAAKIAARRDMPTPAIESCTVLPRAGGRFEVVVRGQGLRSGAVPPRVVVGGRTVRMDELRRLFAEHGLLVHRDLRAVTRARVVTDA